MPNKYSHASVLSHYESRGYIAPSYQAIERRPSSPSSTDYDLYALPSGNTTPSSFNTVPALSDSATTSTTSSQEEEPRPNQSLHSASSSIVTEIYAPQSQPSSPVPQESSLHEKVADTATQSPILEDLPQSPRQSSPPRSRFSAFHDFSPFLTRWSSSASKRNKKPSRRPQEITSETTRMSQQVSAAHSIAPESHSAQAASQSYTSHEYLEPTYDTNIDTDALACLSLDDLPSEPSPLSPDMDILPWEYSPSHLPKQQQLVYQPRGSHPQTHSTDQHHPQPSNTRTSPPPRPATPSRRSSLSRSPAPPLPPSQEIREEQFSSISRTSSFDSVAPPPIARERGYATCPPHAKSKRLRHKSFGRGGV
ncbi:MAG: hypothetical protein Q9220_004061 [cf. Caloplaca sp. 1 TL-2023]